MSTPPLSLRKPGESSTRKADPRRLFGQKIKELRAAQGLTQEDAVDRIGVFRTYMSRMESGQANPTLTMLYKVAEAFGVDVATLLASQSGSPPARVRSTQQRMSRGRVTK